jgi:hypothetical protein
MVTGEPNLIYQLRRHCWLKAFNDFGDILWPVRPIFAGNKVTIMRKAASVAEFICTYCGSTDADYEARVVYHHPDCQCLRARGAAWEGSQDLLDVIEATGAPVADYGEVVKHLAGMVM